MQTKSTRLLVTTAMFSALSAVLMFFEFPLPLLPPFLKFDLSDIPVLVGTFVFGPVTAVIITLVKDLVHLTVSQTGGVGELADFLITSSLALTAGLIYRTKRTTAAAILGSAVGIAVMAAFGATANLYLLLPFYSKMMPLEAIFSICAKINPVITDQKSYILYGVVPFNIIKGFTVSVVTILVYSRLSAVIFKTSGNLSVGKSTVK